MKTDDSIIYNELEPLNEYLEQCKSEDIANQCEDSNDSFKDKAILGGFISVAVVVFVVFVKLVVVGG